MWWVGGNALAYRSPIARGRHVPFHSYDRLAGGSLPARYQYDLPNYVFRCFWTEGFTADGAGWGHGKQCLIWGYPLTGTSMHLKC